MMAWFNRWRHDDRGVVTVEFALVFPVLFTLFLMAFEGGMISMRHFALERAVDLAVRDLRIGTVQNPTRAQLRGLICQNASLIPDCENQLELELLRRDLRNWAAVPAQVACVDRGDPGTPVVSFVTGSNNDLMVLRACARFDPYLPTSGLGRAIVAANSDTAAGGSYALVSTSAFVVEP